MNMTDRFAFEYKTDSEPITLTKINKINKNHSYSAENYHQIFLFYTINAKQPLLEDDMIRCVKKGD